MTDRPVSPEAAAETAADQPAAAAAPVLRRHPEKAHRPDQSQPKKPDWIRVKAPVSQGYKDTRDILRKNRLSTVCEEAGCPNVGECWSQGHATMMIMGEICTRGCSFCNVATGKPEALRITVGGRIAPQVGPAATTVSNVSLLPADLLKIGPAAASAAAMPASAAPRATAPEPRPRVRRPVATTPAPTCGRLMPIAWHRRWTRPDGTVPGTGAAISMTAPRWDRRAAPNAASTASPKAGR